VRPESLAHLAQLTFAVVLLWSLFLTAVDVTPWRLPRNTMVRPAGLLLLVLGLEMTPLRPLEIIAAVGAASFVYAMVNR